VRMRSGYLKSDSAAKRFGLHRTEILHVDISPQAGVVGQVPAWIIGIGVEHDVVTVPEPVRTIVVIGRRHAEVEVVEQEVVPCPSA